MYAKFLFIDFISLHIRYYSESCMIMDKIVDEVINNVH